MLILLRAFSIALTVAIGLGGMTLGASEAMAQEKGKGKPSFAGKPSEKMGKGGRSEEARDHAGERGNKEDRKEKAVKKEKASKKTK